ncbi:MAG: metalloregulator ArsR/SmtB family transcription factor [Pseudomonadota bacterium]
MDTYSAIDAFAALAHDTRLAVFRLLIKQGEKGMAAGDIAGALGSRANTMSVNLAVLSRAGLVTSERDGRSIRYTANMEGLRGLLGYIMEDCCGGRPELCQPMLDELVCDC